MELMLEVSPSALVFFDAAGMVTHANKRAEELLGLTRNTIATRAYNAPAWQTTRLDGTPFPEAELPYSTVKRTKQAAKNIEQAIVWPDGRRVLISVNGAPLLSDSGEFLGMVAAMEDITERKRYEAALNIYSERLRQVTGQSRTFIWETDAQGLYTYANEVTEALFGCKPEELTGKKHFYDLHPAEGREEFKKAALEVFARGASFANLENPIQTKDGRVIWVSTSGSPVLDAGGELKGYRGLDVDITGRKLAENVLRNEQERLKAILDIAGDPIFVKDNEHRIILANRAFNEIFCLGENSAIGKTLVEAVPENERRAFLKVDRAVLDTGITDRREESLTVNGQTRTISTVKTRYIDQAGNRFLVGAIQDLTVRKKAEMMLAGKEEDIHILLNSTAEAIYGVDTKGDCTFCNSACLRILGYKRQEELQGRNMHSVIHGKHADGTCFAAGDCRNSLAYQKGEGVHADEDVFWRADGTAFPVESWSYPQFKDGRIVGGVVTFMDISERKKLQEGLSQALKMESVGRLAGGVAHDFNNIIGAIRGYAEFLEADLPPGNPKQEDVGEILKAASRASALTLQLSAFSRSQALSPSIADLNGIVAETSKMLKRIIGEDILLTLKPSAVPCKVRIDRGQMEQAIMNMVVNARDAMPKGGKLTLETALFTPDQAFFDAHPKLPRGPLVRLQVSDTGHGMTPEVLVHIFEPFFTTKEKGKSVGLGLPMVYGFIKQSGGEIECESSPGAGAVFRIYLPAAKGAVKAPAKAKKLKPAPGGRETVLVVEDDKILLRVTARILGQAGYSVLTASGGAEALKLLEERGKPVDLLVTDVVMPLMNGRELALEAARRKLVLKTLFMSGYTDEIVTRHGVPQPGVSLINKPFKHADLKTKVREVLDSIRAWI